MPQNPYAPGGVYERPGIPLTGMPTHSNQTLFGRPRTIDEKRRLMLTPIDIPKPPPSAPLPAPDSIYSSVQPMEKKQQRAGITMQDVGTVLNMVGSSGPVMPQRQVLGATGLTPEQYMQMTQVNDQAYETKVRAAMQQAQLAQEQQDAAMRNQMAQQEIAQRDRQLAQQQSMGERELALKQQEVAAQEAYYNRPGKQARTPTKDYFDRQGNFVVSLPDTTESSIWAAQQGLSPKFNPPEYRLVDTVDEQGNPIQVWSLMEPNSVFGVPKKEEALVEVPTTRDQMMAANPMDLVSPEAWGSVAGETVNDQGIPMSVPMPLEVPTGNKEFGSMLVPKKAGTFIPEAPKKPETLPLGVVNLFKPDPLSGQINLPPTDLVEATVGTPEMKALIRKQIDEISRANDQLGGTMVIYDKNPLPDGRLLVQEAGKQPIPVTPEEAESLRQSMIEKGGLL